MLIIPNERQASPANNDSPLKANIDKKDAEKDRERERERAIERILCAVTDMSY